MRRLFLFALLACILFAVPAEAQFIGYVSPQTNYQALASNVACTGVAQTFLINNLGQTQHYITVSGLTAAIKFQAEIDGVDSTGTAQRISDVLETPSSGAITGTVSGTGSYPKLQAKVTCTGGNFSLTYSGASATSNTNNGAFLIGQIDKIEFNGAAANTNQVDNFQSPFGNSAGTIYFLYATAGVAGSTLTVSCPTSGNFPNIALIVTLANTTTTYQSFNVPAGVCPLPQVNYTSGGATVGTFTLEYVFSLPGIAPLAYQYGHVTTTTATPFKTNAAGNFTASGFLHTVTINTGAAGTLTLFDLVAASCTGTPATNQVAIITATVATTQTYTYDANFLNGICAKASVAMDYTVSFQ